MSQILARLFYYPSLAWNVAICRVFHVWNWWDQVDPLLFVGAVPLKNDVARLQKIGIRAVVNTCEEYAGPIIEYERCGIEQLRIPTVDFTSPTLDDVRTSVRFIEAHHLRDHAVYVHCKAGRGRSATVALCWLIHAHGIDPSEAIDRLISRRKQVSRTIAERPVVREFWSNRS